MWFGRTYGRKAMDSIQYNCNATAATGTIRSFSFEVLDANTESVVDGMVTVVRTHLRIQSH